jgi:hypothetical protein
MINDKEEKLSLNFTDQSDLTDLTVGGSGNGGVGGIKTRTHAYNGVGSNGQPIGNGNGHGDTWTRHWTWHGMVTDTDSWTWNI